MLYEEPRKLSFEFFCNIVEVNFTFLFNYRIIYLLKVIALWCKFFALSEAQYFD